MLDASGSYFIPVVSAMAVMAVAAVLLYAHVSRRMGRTPHGADLRRISQSPNFSNGTFHNIDPTPMLTSRRSFPAMMWHHFMSRKPASLRPDTPVENDTVDFRNLPSDTDCAVWLGHSAILLIVNNRTILVDPALVSGAPLRFLNRPFDLRNPINPDDLPVIDCLLVTHDHYDHLDYETVSRIHRRIISIVCPLGVGGHFESWGFDSDQITELDWWQSAVIPGGTTVTCCPARHFSGRGFRRNLTLWASFMLSTPGGRNIFISGDSGYGSHFKKIAGRFPEIDLAFMENGQYNADWAYIHTMPDKLPLALLDLAPRRVATVHHSRFALARHSWTEPLENLKSLGTTCPGITILTPKIGEIININ